MSYYTQRVRFFSKLPISRENIHRIEEVLGQKRNGQKLSGLYVLNYENLKYENNDYFPYLYVLV